MSNGDKPLVWLHGAIKTPPLSTAARIEAGMLLRQLQKGEQPGMPRSRVMPVIGTHCHELRIQDRNATWRIVYRVDADAIVVVDVFSKKTQRTPPSVLRICRARLRQYDSDCGE